MRNITDNKTVFIRPDEYKGFDAEILFASKGYMIAEDESGMEYFIDVKTAKVVSQTCKHANVFPSKAVCLKLWQIKSRIDGLRECDPLSLNLADVRVTEALESLDQLYGRLGLKEPDGFHKLGEWL